MVDIAVIILTKNEKLHMGRCLERLQALEATRVIVVDCFSTDGTQQIARECGAEVVEHIWPGNQAAQFNWALDNLPLANQWILRLDADEYLLPETMEEIKNILPRLSPDVTSVSMSRARRWFGHPILHGGHDLWFTRLFRTGFARYPEGQVMDEHLEVSSGREIKLVGHFVDDSLIDFASWQAKHRDYAHREAFAYWERRCCQGNESGTTCGSEQGRRKKALYDKLPLFLRAVLYFCLRYFLLRGFLDGRAGLSWNFWQGLWYRWIVDCEIVKLRKGVK